MIRRATGPAPAPRKRVARVPGHRLIAGSYEQGLAGWTCECGVGQPPAPPITATARRYDHLEIHVSKTEKLVASGRPLQFAGKSIYEQIWEQMDTAYDALMRGGEPALSDDPEADREAFRAWGLEQGVARGLAAALAVLGDPYTGTVEKVREQAHSRWEASLSEEEYEKLSQD